VLGPNTEHPTPKPETLITDKEMRMQRTDLAFLEGRGKKSIVIAAVVQLKYCVHQQHAIGWTNRQRAGPRTEGFFVRFVEPWFGEILGVTGDPYRVPFKVSRG
jgi:hypothetical protein